MVTFSGNLQTVSASLALEGFGSGSVTICEGDCTGANILGSATTDGSGNFTAGPFATNGTAIPAYLELKGSADVTTLAYPGEPAAANTAFRGIVFPSSFESELADISLAIPGAKCGSAMGLIGILVTDCTGAQITSTANLTVSVTQNGTAVGDGPIDVGKALATFDGLFIDCEVPPGATTISVTDNGMSFLPNTVTSVTGEATEAVIRPGY